MAGQSVIDNVVQIFKHGLDPRFFSPAMQESLVNVLKNADSVDNMADDLAEWRRGLLRQDDLPRETRVFLESATTTARISAVPKITEVSTAFRGAIESNLDNINVDGYMRTLRNSDGVKLSDADTAVIRSSFDELLQTRENAIAKIIDENPGTTRQEVLDQWAKQFDDGADTRRGASAASRPPPTEAEALKSMRDDMKTMKSRMDGGLSSTDELWVKWKKRIGMTGLAALGVVATDTALGNPLGQKLGEISQEEIPFISFVADKLSGAMFMIVDGVAFLSGAPAETAASVVIGAMEERGEIPRGEEGDDHRDLIGLIAHAATGNVLGVTKLASGAEISGTEIDEILSDPAAEGLSSRERVAFVYERVKDKLAENTQENEMGLLGSGIDRTRTEVEERRTQIDERVTQEVDRARQEGEDRARRLLEDNLIGGNRRGALSDNMNSLLTNTDLMSDNTSTVFNAVSDNLDKLGVGGFAKNAFKLIGAIASVVGFFNKEAGESIQKFALSFTGVDDKIASLRDAVSNNRVVSQFGDNYDLGAGPTGPNQLATASL